MSGRRARRNRRAQEEVGLPHDLVRTADRMLAVDFSGVLATRPRQVIVGWMRHAFEQSRVIAQLHVLGLGHAAAPNWRSLCETSVRLQWLDGVDLEDRAGAVDAMIEHDRENVYTELKNLQAMGYESSVDLEEMESLVLDVTKIGQLKTEATKFVPAARASKLPSIGLYKAWRQETQYSHATAVLGVAYAPVASEGIGFGQPPQADPDLELHVMITLLVMMTTCSLLEDEGVARSKTIELAAAHLE